MRCHRSNLKNKIFTRRIGKLETQLKSSYIFPGPVQRTKLGRSPSGLATAAHLISRQRYVYVLETFLVVFSKVGVIKREFMRFRITVFPGSALIFLQTQILRVCFCRICQRSTILTSLLGIPFICKGNQLEGLLYLLGFSGTSWMSCNALRSSYGKGKGVERLRH